MKKLLFIVFLFLAISPTWAKTKQTQPARPTDLCSLILGNFAPEDAVALPVRAINPAANALQIRLFSPLAAEGMRKVINLDHGVRVFNLLERLGLLNDDQWAQLYLLSHHNGPLDLKAKYPEDRVAKYLIRHIRRAKRGDIEQVVSQPGWERRHDLFFDIAVEAFAPFDNTLSVNALVTTFTEIRRQFFDLENAKKTTREHVEANVETLLKSLDSWAEYHPRPAQGLWLPLRKGLEKILLMEEAFLLIGWLWRTLWEGDLTKQIDPFRPSEAPKNFVEVPSSRQLYILNSDPFGLRYPARQFLRDSIFDTSNSLFSPAFASNLVKASPEVSLVLGDAMSNRFAVVGTEVVNGPFGQVSFEGQKSLSRDALYLSALRRDSEPFRFAKDAVSVETVDEYTSTLVSDLELLADPAKVPGGFDIDAVHAFQVFLMLDAVGRGKDDFIRVLHEEYNIAGNFGNDYERIVVELLSRYPHIAHSFMLLSKEYQNLVVRCFLLIYHYNAGQVIQLESGRHAFLKLVEMGATQRELAFIFHRSYLSFLSLPPQGQPPVAGTTRMDQYSHQKWMILREAVLSLDFDVYKDWYAESLGLEDKDYDPEFGITKLFLAGQAGSKYREDYDLVSKTFSLLDEETKSSLKRLMELPILPYFSADLRRDIQTETSNDSFEVELTKWMKLLALAFNAVEHHQYYPSYLENVRKAGEVRINLYALREFIRKHGTQALDGLTLTAQVKLGAFEIEIRDANALVR